MPPSAEQLPVLWALRSAHTLDLKSIVAGGLVDAYHRQDEEEASAEPAPVEPHAESTIRAAVLKGAVSEEVQDSIKAGLVRTQMDDAVRATEYEASLQRAARLRDNRAEAARVKAAEKEIAKSKAIEDALRARDAAEEAAAIRVAEEEAARVRAAEEAIAAPADPVWRMLKLQQGLTDWRRVAEAALVIEASKVRCDAHFRQTLLSNTLDTLQIESVGWSLYRRVVHRRAFSRMRKYCQQQRVSRIAFTFSLNVREGYFFAHRMRF